MKIEELLVNLKIPLDEKHVVWFDAEAFSDVDSYITVFKDLIQISLGKLEFDSVTIKSGFSDVKNDSNDKPYLIEINLIKNTISDKLKIYCNGWFDLQFLYDFNSLNQRFFNLAEQFYPLKTNDQSMLIVFVNDFNFDKLDKEGLIENDYSLYRPKKWDLMDITDIRFLEKIM